jgi:hypothetical protein
MDHEAEPVHGRADHRDPAGAGGGRSDGRCLPRASWQSSTTSRASACRWLPTPHCRACGLYASSRQSSLRRGRPAECVSDNGTELTGMAVLHWCQPRRSRSPSHRAIPATPKAWRYPPEGTPQPALARKPTDRTSKSAVPTIDPTRRRHGYSGPHRPPPSRSPHGHERCILPMDAKDKGPYAPRSYGRSVVALYNDVRPHSALGKLTPTEYADRSTPGPQRAERCATPRASRPAPLLHRAPWAQMSPGFSPLLDDQRGSGQLQWRGRHRRVSSLGLSIDSKSCTAGFEGCSNPSKPPEPTFSPSKDSHRPPSSTMRDFKLHWRCSRPHLHPFAEPFASQRR